MSEQTPTTVTCILAALTVALVACGENKQASEQPRLSVMVAESFVEEPMPDEPLLVQVEVASSGSIETPSRGYVLLSVSTEVDIAELQLHVRCIHACAVLDSPDTEWTSLGGFRANVGELAAGEERSVVVVLELSSEVAEYRVHATYDDLDGGERQASTPPVETQLSRTLTDRAVYAAVQVALSERAVGLAEHYIGEEQYRDALEVVDAAYEANVEVGLALRITGRLREAQRKLADVRTTLKQRMTPKLPPPQRRRVIEIISGR